VIRAVRLVVAALAVAGATAGEAAAQAPTTYGGGRLPTAAVPARYEPTMGVSMQPRGDRIAVRFDSSILCGRDVFEIVGRRVVPFDGAGFTAQGATVSRVAGGRLRFEWTLAGRLTGGSFAGNLHVVGVRRSSGRRRACTAKPDRPFEARSPGAPAGGPAHPQPRGFYAGTSSYVIADGMLAPVALRASADAGKVTARWTIAAPCRRGPREHFANLSPASRVRADGSFARSERFTVRYADALVRYRARFAGRFAGTGATGTLRLRARVYNRRGTRLRTRCDSGTRTWNAG